MMTKEQSSISLLNALDNVCSSGLTLSMPEFDRLKKSIKRECSIFFYKRATPLLWAVFLGGTGTGKSLCFNALCGADISESGVERPKTQGPIAYLHETKLVNETFPLTDLEIHRIESPSPDKTRNSGISGHISIIEHKRTDLEHLAIVDTPDLDSLEIGNREIAEVFYLLADIIIFVASQEKYADAVPSQFFQRVYHEGKPYFFLINKASPELTRDEVVRFFREQKLDLTTDHLYPIPYLKNASRECITEDSEFTKFKTVFFDFCRSDRFMPMRRDSERHEARALSRKIDSLLDQVSCENDAVEEWLGILAKLYTTNSHEITTKLEQHYKKTSQDHLQREIKKIFAKYDILRKPRGYVIRIITAPLKLLGITTEKTSRDHAKELHKVRRNIDITPILLVLEQFNQQVLEQLSPEDETSPLYLELRKPDSVMSEKEIRIRIEEEQDKLAHWLEETFADMTRGLSKTKEWGIYTTAILWGLMIISFEIVLLGGIGILEAALDTILAPFVTKGSAGLFASREIKKIARELDQRYRAGLLSILKEQKDRYSRGALSTSTSPETIEMIRSFRHELGDII